MSDGNGQVEVEARNLGWVPQEEFRGDKARWVDAEMFVQRGHEVMPILKQNNARLVSQVDALQRQTNELTQMLKESTQSLEALKEFSQETIKERVKAAKQEVLTALAAAKESGDIAAEVRLLDQLGDLKDAARAQAEPKKEEPKPAAGPAIDPQFTAWCALPENSWFGTNKRKTSLAIAIAGELREDPANASLIGAAFYNRVAAETAKALGEGKPAVVEEEARAASKVEGGRGGSGGSGSGGKGKGYADLPADAKAACDKQGKQFIGRAGYKTAADWNTYYASMYFAGEQ